MLTRTLAVDDDQTMVELIGARLEEAGIPVDLATSAGEALKLMENNNYHVVVCDIKMPGMSGVELVSALKEYSSLVQILMLTSEGALEYVEECLDRGAFEFLTKTEEEMDRLPEMVTGALERISRWTRLLGRSKRKRQEQQVSP